MYGNVQARPLKSEEETPYKVINIKKSTYEELQKYELKATKAPIPTLRESFEILKERPAPFVINVEVKDSDPDIIHAVLDLAKEIGVLE